VALVTGGCVRDRPGDRGGDGARRCAVAVAGRAEADAAATVALINAAGGQATAIGGDVTREADVAAMVARTVSAFGRIDCAFNNAGIAPRAVGPAGLRRAVRGTPDDTGAFYFSDVQWSSVLRDDRSAEAVVDARGHHVDILTNAFAVIQRRDKRRIEGDADIAVAHEQMIVFKRQ